MSSQPKIDAVYHLTLTVLGVIQSTEFFTNYLGFQVAVEIDPLVVLVNGGTLLGLGPAPDPTLAIPADRFNENLIGLDHLSFYVDSLQDLEAAALFFDENGINHGEIKDLGPGFAIRAMAVRDPDKFN